MHIICDRAYENQPCSRTKLAQFFEICHHNFWSVSTNTLQSLTVMENLMEDPMKLTEWKHSFQN